MQEYSLDAFVDCIETFLISSDTGKTGRKKREYGLSNFDRIQPVRGGAWSAVSRL